MTVQLKNVLTILQKYTLYKVAPLGKKIAYIIVTHGRK